MRQQQQQQQHSTKGGRAREAGVLVVQALALCYSIIVARPRTVCFSPSLIMEGGSAFMHVRNTRRDDRGGGGGGHTAVYAAVPIVWMQDPILHTRRRPRCSDATCPCHREEGQFASNTRLTDSQRNRP